MAPGGKRCQSGIRNSTALSCWTCQTPHDSLRGLHFRPRQTDKHFEIGLGFNGSVPDKIDFAVFCYDEGSLRVFERSSQKFYPGPTWMPSKDAGCCQAIAVSLRKAH